MSRMKSKTLKMKILRTAYDLFQKKGYDNVSIGEICASVGITKPTFYHYIHSKDDLLTSFYQELNETLPEKIQEEASTGSNYFEQIKNVFDAIYSQSIEFGPELYSQLFISNLKEDKGTFDATDNLTREMTALFKKAQESGQIKHRGDPGALYLICSKLCFGYGVTWCLDNGKGDLLEEFHHALEVLLT